MVSFRHSFLTLGQLPVLLFIWGKGVCVLEIPAPRVCFGSRLLCVGGKGHPCLALNFRKESVVSLQASWLGV